LLAGYAKVVRFCLIFDGGFLEGSTPNVISSESIIIYSHHPLALSLTKDAICSDASLGARVTAYSKGSQLLRGTRNQLLILDTCSVEDWTACLHGWLLDGGHAIALVWPELHSGELELEMLYLGIAGVVSFADLTSHLPKVICAVAQGRLWFRRDVLHAYVRETNIALRGKPRSHGSFTARETQIMDFLLQGFPNRLIAQKLSISERTAKFHVSNILRKFNVDSRRELCNVSASGPQTPRLACLPDVRATRCAPLILSRKFIIGPERQGG
jgi:DNA-binding CsgD family transcriptional regulator